MPERLAVHDSGVQLFKLRATLRGALFVSPVRFREPMKWRAFDLYGSGEPAAPRPRSLLRAARCALTSGATPRLRTRARALRRAGALGTRRGLRPIRTY